MSTVMTDAYGVHIPAHLFGSTAFAVAEVVEPEPEVASTTVDNDQRKVAGFFGRRRKN